MNKYLLTITLIIVVFSIGLVVRNSQEQASENEPYLSEEEIAKSVKDDEEKMSRNEGYKEVFNNTNNEETKDESQKSPESFINCLAEAGLVIYGSRTCPACTSLANSLGGYEAIKPIYVECSEEWERCSLEMQTNYVPEIQIKGELYNDSRSLDAIADRVNCEI